MGNLLDDLGDRYVNEFFSNSFFRHDSKVYKFEGMVRDRTVAAYQLVGEPLSKVTDWLNVRLPGEVFDNGFQAFSWPKLGYRNTVVGDGIVVAAYTNAQRTTRRGLSEDLLSLEYSKASNLFMSALSEYPSTRTIMYPIYTPKWFTYHEAMAMLYNRKAVSIALNEDICLTYNIDQDREDALFAIMFRDRPVGVISRQGQITFRNQKMSNMNMFKKMLG